jgi:hypothetical protein
MSGTAFVPRSPFMRSIISRSCCCPEARREPGHLDHGGGSRDPRAARAAAGRRLHRGAGLPVQRAASGGGDHVAAGAGAGPGQGRLNGAVIQVTAFPCFAAGRDESASQISC